MTTHKKDSLVWLGKCGIAFVCFGAAVVLVVVYVAACTVETLVGKEGR